MRKLILLLSLTFLLWTTDYGLSTSHAAIPHVMNYQGKATDKAGAPLNGSYGLTFRIYNHATAGDPNASGDPYRKWTETHQNVQITNGIFSVQLGSVTPLNLPFDEDYWISLQIDTDSEMTPRTKLASVGYAYKADKATEAESASVISIPFYIQGFELEYATPHHIKVTPGSADINNRILTAKNYSPLIDISDNANYISGRNNPNPWIYIYLYNNNNAVSCILADTAPDKSDSSGNMDGVKRYYIQSNVAYRCIGAVRLDTAGSGNIIQFTQAVDTVYYSIPPFFVCGHEKGVWHAVNVSSVVPTSISTSAYFFGTLNDNSSTYGFKGFNDTNTVGNVFFCETAGRGGGAVWLEVVSDQIYYLTTSGTYPGLTGYVKAYKLNIR